MERARRRRTPKAPVVPRVWLLSLRRRWLAPISHLCGNHRHWAYTYVKIWDRKFLDRPAERIDSGPAIPMNFACPVLLACALRGLPPPYRDSHLARGARSKVVGRGGRPEP